MVYPSFFRRNADGSGMGRSSRGYSAQVIKIAEPVLRQAGNRSALGVVLWITLLGVFLSTSAQAAVFTVNSPFDVSDSNAGDGVCETAPGNGVCTLRAAIEETNFL